MLWNEQDTVQIIEIGTKIWNVSSSDNTSGTMRLAQRKAFIKAQMQQCFVLFREQMYYDWQTRSQEETWDNQSSLHHLFGKLCFTWQSIGILQDFKIFSKITHGKG